MNKLNKLTWKYFFKQKIVEITKFLGWLILIAMGIFVIVIILYYLGKLTYLILNFTCSNSLFDCLFEYALAGTLSLMALFIGGFLLWLLFYEVLFKEWIIPNWKEASKRAKEDFKREKKCQ